MTIRIRAVSLLAAATGLLLLLGSQPSAFAKGQKISVADDPSMKEGSPELVLVEIADFQ
jgi:hypothetical protein